MCQGIEYTVLLMWLKNDKIMDGRKGKKWIFMIT